MYGRAGLDRFRKAQSTEPFAVTTNAATKTAILPASGEAVHPIEVSANQAPGSDLQNQHHNSQNVVKRPFAVDVPPTSAPTQHATPVGGGHSNWQPPDWAIEPRPGVYYLEVLKDGEVLDRVNLDKRRHIFGRQFHACDFVLDHSVSRQHAAVIPHKDGRCGIVNFRCSNMIGRL